MAESPLNEIKIRPIKAKMAPIIFSLDGGVLKMTEEKSGTKITLNPVINPPLEAVVNCNPIVWKR
jgi:hypothetical protein